MIPSRHSGAESDDGAKATTDTYFRMHTSRNQRTSRPIRVRCAFQSRNKRERARREKIRRNPALLFSAAAPVSPVTPTSAGDQAARRGRGEAGNPPFPISGSLACSALF